MMESRDVIGVDVECLTCGNTKAPEGRSASHVVNYCRSDHMGEGCPGYHEKPLPGWLFRGEVWTESFPDIPVPELSACYEPVAKQPT